MRDLSGGGIEYKFSERRGRRRSRESPYERNLTVLAFFKLEQVKKVDERAV